MMKRILAISIIGILTAGLVNAAIGTYWKTIDDIIPRITETRSIGSAVKRLLKLWTKDLDVSGIFTLGGEVGTGGLDLNGQKLTLDIDGGMYFQSPHNDRLNLIGGNMGIGGGLSIGSTYYTTTPPTDGLLVEGNVGIGTTSPANALSVVGGITSTTTVSAANFEATGTILTPKVIGGTATTSDLYLQTTSGVGATGADMHFLVGNNGATEALKILNSGNLQLTNGGYIYGDTTNSFMRLNATGGTLFGYSDNYFAGLYNGVGIYNNGTRVMYVGENGGVSIGSSYTFTDAGAGNVIIQGNVGIGTTSPDRKLDALDASSPQIRLSAIDGTVYTDLQTDSSGIFSILPNTNYMGIASGLSIGSTGYTTTPPTDGLLVEGLIRAATSKWWHAYCVGAVNMSPGASSATWTAATGDHLAGYEIDAANEYLYITACVHNDWDEESDIEIKVTFEIMVAGTAEGDTVDIAAQCYYKGHDGAVATKTQTPEAATTIDDAAQYELFVATIVIDHDLGGNVVDEGDKLSIRLNLETDTSEVDDILISHVNFRYRTAKMGPEIE